MTVIRAAFVDLTNGDRIDLSFNPDTITDSKSVDVNSPIIPGTSHPRTSVNAAGSRILNFTVRLVRLRELEPISIVRDQVSWFYSVVSPYPGNSFEEKIFTPIQFVWGELYDLPVIIRSVECEFLYFRGTDALPEWADLTLQLEELSSTVIFNPQIRTNNSAFIRYFLE